MCGAALPWHGGCSGGGEEHAAQSQRPGLPEEVSDDRHALGIYSHDDTAAHHLPQGLGLRVGAQDQSVGTEAQVPVPLPYHLNEQVAALLAVKDLAQRIWKLSREVQDVNTRGIWDGQRQLLC